jgi:uncharacterized protein (DUF302 family)
MAGTEIVHRSYGNSVDVRIPFDAAVAQSKEALKHEGFGVLCEIDVSRTFMEKLGVPFRPYTILGACDPTQAYRALTAELDLGLLLPCNVVVYSDEAGATRVAAIDASAMLRIVGNSELDEVASGVNARLRRVLERVAAAGD